MNTKPKFFIKRSFELDCYCVYKFYNKQMWISGTQSKIFDNNILFVNKRELLLVLQFLDFYEVTELINYQDDPSFDNPLDDEFYIQDEYLINKTNGIKFQIIKLNE